MDRLTLILIEVTVLLILSGTWLWFYRNNYNSSGFDVFGALSIIGVAVFLLTGFIVSFESKYYAHKNYHFEIVDDYGCLSFQNDLKVIKDMKSINYLKAGKPIIQEANWNIFNIEMSSYYYYRDMPGVVLLTPIEEIDETVEELIK